MGCDIHVRVEIKYALRTGKSNGDCIIKWVSGDTYYPNPYFDEHLVNPYSPDENHEFLWNEIYAGRDYMLFAMLANVRNYNGLPYIVEARGIPDDACSRTMQAYKAWGDEAHSASYLTLKELIDFYHDPWHGSDRDVEEDVWKGARESLNDLIAPLKARADELGAIPYYLWEEKPAMAEAKAELIRIVFWFDN